MLPFYVFGKADDTFLYVPGRAYVTFPCVQELEDVAEAVL